MQAAIQVPILPGCDVLELCDKKGVGILVAIAPNMAPLVFWNGEWELASPIVGELIKKAAKKELEEKYRIHISND